MIYNNDKDALYARDKRLWYSDDNDTLQETCEHCGEILVNGYYEFHNVKLCEACAKLEFKECFEELEDLDELKQTCDYESEEDLINTIIEEDLYKYWRSF